MPFANSQTDDPLVKTFWRLINAAIRRWILTQISISEDVPLIYHARREESLFAYPRSRWDVLEKIILPQIIGDIDTQIGH